MIDGKILIIDDNKNILKGLEILLKFEFQHVETISNPNLLLSYTSELDIDLILLDMNFTASIKSGNEGIYWLKKAKEKFPDTLVIMMTAFGTVDLAVKALKEGATDFILKPWDNNKLLATLKTAYTLKTTTKSLKNMSKKTHQLKQIINENIDPIIGDSVAINSVHNLTQKISPTDVDVLITGPNGTGKELIARQIHSLSTRKNEVFIKVDIGSLSETLFESELFGHVKGAFTDAIEDRVGKFEIANNGTLFLDEIGNLSIKMQAKLLSVIQNRVIFKVGSNIAVPLNVRIIYATNSNLNTQVEEGTFREDLLYRISTINIKIPSLIERKEDIPLIAEHYLKKFTSKYGKKISFSPQALKKLSSYNWPGNIRELRHTIERAIILCDSSKLSVENLMLNEPASKNNLVSNKNSALTLKDMEIQIINSTLFECNGNYSEAAEKLGISRQTLYNKLKAK